MLSATIDLQRGAKGFELRKDGWGSIMRAWTPPIDRPLALAIRLELILATLLPAWPYRNSSGPHSDFPCNRNVPLSSHC